MIVYDVAIKVLGTEIFPQGNVAGLISGITFIVLLSQEKPLRWKEINTYTQAHTHTHAHAHTQKLIQYFFPKSRLGKAALSNKWVREWRQGKFTNAIYQILASKHVS